MNELLIIKTFNDGSVLVQDNYGDTKYMTKEEYELYCRNIEI